MPFSYFTTTSVSHGEISFTQAGTAGSTSSTFSYHNVGTSFIKASSLIRSATTSSSTRFFSTTQISSGRFETSLYRNVSSVIRAESLVGGTTSSGTEATTRETSFNGISWTAFTDANGVTDTVSGTHNLSFATTTVTSTTNSTLSVSTTQTRTSHIITTTSADGFTTIGSVQLGFSASTWTATTSTSSAGSGRITTYASGTHEQSMPWSTPPIFETFYTGRSPHLTLTIIEPASSEWLWVITVSDSATTVTAFTCGELTDLGVSVTKTTVGPVLASVAQTWNHPISNTVTGTATVSGRVTATLTTAVSSLATVTFRSPVNLQSTTGTFGARVSTTTTAVSTAYSSVTFSFPGTSRTRPVTLISEMWSLVSHLVHQSDLSMTTASVHTRLTFTATTSVCVADKTTPTWATNAVSETVVSYRVWATGGEEGDGHLRNFMRQFDWGGFQPATDAGSSRPRVSDWTHYTDSTGGTASTVSLLNLAPEFFWSIFALIGGTFSTAGEVVEQSYASTFGGNPVTYFGGIDFKTTNHHLALVSHKAHRSTRVDSSGGSTSGKLFLPGGSAILQEHSGSFVRWISVAAASVYWGFTRSLFVTGESLTLRPHTLTFPRHKTSAFL